MAVSFIVVGNTLPLVGVTLVSTAKTTKLPFGGQSLAPIGISVLASTGAS